ncbi:hypothetical protein HNP37_004562 [Flavobacterium nitrogenifigens]|uniref:Uncharacterized protein n=2 Tax=Flavobacterium TaxID=237 RepID=A0A7W7N8Z5_9FLAO|nr:MULTISPECIES: hypothetical protein [Flavobacterium]MBB4804470.1 hypothetical protein [Flavobacterium nitrogenifigens]MBB6389402.1 hypothetical protein [Flavobacterium notoginsengisoli]
MKRKIVIGIFIFSIAITIRFFCGVYHHDEFPEEHFFIKHRPIWKWTFYSPIKMSDTKIEELSKEEQIEQKYFNEFIRDQGLSR